MESLLSTYWQIIYSHQSISSYLLLILKSILIAALIVKKCRLLKFVEPDSLQIFSLGDFYIITQIFVQLF